MKVTVKKEPTAEQRLDGWMNAMSGLGVDGRDKRTAAQVFWQYLDEGSADLLYAGDDIFPRIVDEVVNEAFREGYRFKTDATTARFKELGVDSKAMEAAKKARQYGGAAILKLTKNGAPMDKPMGPNEKVERLIVLSRWELIAGSEVDSDFFSDNFGYPTTYQIQLPFSDAKNTQLVHWTRLVRLHGVMLPRRLFITNNYWHDSVLTRVYNAVRNYQTAHDSTAAIVHDFNVGVWKIKNLAEMLASPEGEAKLRARVNTAQFGKSVIKGVLIDADMESWEEKARTVTGLSDVLTKIGNRLVAATDMPHTKLLGESPSGSNSTGNSTTMSWYDVVASWQRGYLAPVMMQLAKALNPSHPEDDVPKFAPLWQMDDLERADVNLKQAQADRSNIEAGILSPEEVAVSRFGGEDGYSLETELSEDRDPEAPDNETPEPVDPDQDTGGGAPPNPGEKPPADPRERKDQMNTQAVILSKKSFSKAEAGEWVKSMGWSLANAAESDDEYRFVQEDEKSFKEGSLKSVQLKHGIRAMMGVKHMADSDLQDPDPDEDDGDDKEAQE